jgi:hypothetical protein
VNLESQVAVYKGISLILLSRPLTLFNTLHLSYLIIHCKPRNDRRLAIHLELRAGRYSEYHTPGRCDLPAWPCSNRDGNEAQDLPRHAQPGYLDMPEYESRVIPVVKFSSTCMHSYRLYIIAQAHVIF